MFNYGKSFYPVLFDKSNELYSLQIFFINTFPNNNIFELIK